MTNPTRLRIRREGSSRVVAITRLLPSTWEDIRVTKVKIPCALHGTCLDDGDLEGHSSTAILLLVEQDK